MGVDKMNGHKEDILHRDKLRQRKGNPQDKFAGRHHGEEKDSREDTRHKKTFGKTPDGVGK
jgi:hypothetical protein